MKIGHFGIGETAAHQDYDFRRGGFAPSEQAGFAFGPSAGAAAGEYAVDLRKPLEGGDASEGIGQMFEGAVKGDAASG